MTPPKAKAKELVNKFIYILPTIHNPYLEIGEGDEQTSKQCALIAVDEILSLFKHNPYDSKGYYYTQVKTEIQKL